MAKFLSKHLGKLALMTAAALWASCSDAKEEKVDEHATHKTQASQSKDIQNAIKNINKNANSKYLPSREMDTSGVTALYGCINCGKGRIIDTVLDTSPKCLYGTCGSGKTARKPKGEINIPGVSDVEISDIIADDKPLFLKAIRERKPGLRHIFNKYRKNKPDFKQGTLILKLNIGTLGIVSDIIVESTTTDYPEFDEAIVKAVIRWKFPKSKTGGNVTIPFAFREDN